MIVECLRSVGDEVELRDVRAPLVDVPAGTDVVVVYGDLDGIEDKVRVAVEARARAGVPIVVNAAYDGGGDRAAAMVRCLRRWDPDGTGLVFLSVFSSEAEHDPALREVRRQVVALPKTVRVPTARRHARERLPLERRAGICIGELGKLGRRRIIEGIDAGEAVRRLRSAVPEAELFAYDQYGTDGDAEAAPEGVTVLPYRDKGFLSWLGSLRLFVSPLWKPSVHSTTRSAMHWTKWNWKRSASRSSRRRAGVHAAQSKLSRSKHGARRPQERPARPSARRGLQDRRQDAGAGDRRV